MSQAATLDLFYDGFWNAVPLLSADGIEIERQIDDDGLGRTKFTVTINNESGNYDPDNIVGTLHGKIGRNTPARIRHSGASQVFGEASSWEVDQTQDFTTPGNGGVRWVKLTAQGVLRRIGRWTDLLESPMRRRISTYPGLLGHWPLEDDREARSASATSGRPAVASGVSFGDSESPAGAASAVKVAAGSTLQGYFLPGSTSAGWQVAFSMKLPAMPPTASHEVIFRWRCTNGYTWWWDVNNGSYRVDVRNDAGALLYTNNITFGVGAEPNQWITFRMKAEPSGGNVAFNMAWYAQNDNNSYSYSDTFAGTVGAPWAWWQQANAVTDGAWFSHVFALSGVATNLMASDGTKSFNGYTGETSGRRFSRITAELGVPRYWFGNLDDTVPMGPQKPLAFEDQLKVIARTDDMIIYDERFDASGLTLRPRRAMLNQAPVLTLAHPGDLAVPSAKRKTDDDGTANRVTAKDDAGGEYTTSRLTGRLSILPPPAGAGEYRKSVDVSVSQDASLRDIAEWHLAKGTLDRPRFPDITVDLLANPGLETGCETVNMGDVIRVTGLAFDALDMRVMGITQRIGADTRTYTFRCEPYDVWLSGIYDSTVRRYDSRDTTLNAGYSSSAATLVLTYPTPSSEWSTAAASQPYDIKVGGEVIRVPVGGMGPRAGAGPYTQTITGAVRAVNGAVKAQLAGAEVHIANPARYAF